MTSGGVGGWRSVPEWCEGNNANFGTCAWTAIGNWYIANGGGVMPPVEIMSAARVMSGLNPYDRSTDHGEHLEDVFKFIQDFGWPGDPTIRIEKWWKIDPLQIAASIIEHQCVLAWCMLPLDENGWDLTDAALDDDVPGTGPHAVTIVGADATGYTLITWGAPQHVSYAWWQKYGRDCYVTLLASS